MRKIHAVAFPLALSLVLPTACGKMGKRRDIPGPNDKVYTVGTSAVESRTIPDSIEIKGVFIPDQRLQVKSDFTGKVQALSVIEGQRVNTGDALLKIEDEKIPFVLDRQRAELREAEAQLDLDQKTTGAGGPAEETVEAAPENQPEEAAANAPAATPNVDENAPEQNPNQNPEAMPPSGQNPYLPSSARPPFGLKRGAMRSGPILPRPAVSNNAPSPELTESRISLDQAKIDRIKAEVALSEKQLAGATLLATLDGFVSKVNVAEGSMVKPDDILLEIVKVDPIELSLQIPKEDLARVNKNMDVKVNVVELGGTGFGGEISYIGVEIDPVKKTLELRTRIPNPDLKIKAGLEGFANLAVANKTHRALLVPSQAIRSEGNKKFVYIVDGQVAERREVETGFGIEDRIEIKKGLKLGDRVVTNGVDALKENEEFVKASS